MAIEQPAPGLSFPTTVDVLRESIPVLTPAFVAQVHSVVLGFPDDLRVASLIVYSPEKRHMIINDLKALLGRKRYVYFTADLIGQPNEDFLASTYARIAELERRVENVEQLPPSPEVWQLFMDGITFQEKRALMAVLGHSLGGRRYAWGGLESEKTVGDLRQTEVGSDFVPANKVDLRKVWLSLAFRGS